MALPQPPTTHHPQHAAPTPPRNGLGTAGLVLGLLGLPAAFLPVIGLVAWPLVVLGLVLGALGVARASRGRATNKGIAVAGVVLSAAGLAVCALWAAFFGKAASDAARTLDDLEREANKESRVVYEISGDAPKAAVTYTTYSDGGSATSKEDATSLPWTKELTVKGFLSGGTLTAMTGAEGGTVTCRISVDGVEKKTATATGAFVLASCSNF
ncbi:MmpS family transport accessory protein [Saccharothrix australiensis]|uniref:MmpS family membrane protein n=1 Tax=Saccharothrix australiensis TaxID=2072 RepID=A0A495W7T8_9PSEU|nr:MmpS family transport accessory protein [Saccharothrix australiensis]RKT57811.1 MmpS family membrane protein [Saccharothrix australiensis]